QLRRPQERQELPGVGLLPRHVHAARTGSDAAALVSSRYARRRLPELDQHTEGAARRDECRLRAGAQLLLVDDAHAIGLELRDVGIECVDIDRDVMEPFAALRDEAFDEAAAPRLCLDQLDLVAVEVKAGDVERAVPSRMRRPPQLEGEIRLEKAQGRVDVAYGD